ncbi:hypothetical protein DL766_008436 [Monosporascus sp. MC13-8B]|uniref:Uncharacterized protein n=1 Tax=Monosporascus cannonballus TaxID=155416 RepID=A0ABY0HKF0_9PEZI|nr:hypothetical protein DL763_004522 [Monosporascus cannonballus]RYO93904.1 hypothetical protein DL762_000859 [Monosporascus cannonballus]RYP19464.1 hypothetical protein DL766_008436 [Monosporascus sp. MC13-8B]
MATSLPHHLPLTLRRLSADQLRDLVGRLRAVDPTVNAAADALINDMLPQRRLKSNKAGADVCAFGPVAGDRRFNAADLRELALGLCVLDPGAGAAALEGVVPVPARKARWGEGKDAKHVGVGLGPQEPDTPTSTDGFTTDSSSSDGSASTPPSSSSSPVAGIEGGDKPKTKKKGAFKKWFIYFLESQEYVNEGIAFRGY